MEERRAGRLLLQHAAGEPLIVAGGTVRISGLKSRPELNGQRGVVVSFHTASGRYHVKLDSGEMVALRPACSESRASFGSSRGVGDDDPQQPRIHRSLLDNCCHRHGNEKIQHQSGCD